MIGAFMKNQFVTLFISIACAFFIAGSSAYGAEQTPEAFVKDFYAWYTAEDKLDKGPPENNDAIYDYVHTCTVNRLRKEYRKGLYFTNYFYQTNGFDSELDPPPTVHKSVKISDTVSLVPVAHGTIPYILVFVQKEKGMLRIIKVEDVTVGE